VSNHQYFVRFVLYFVYDFFVDNMSKPTGSDGLGDFVASQGGAGGGGREDGLGEDEILPLSMLVNAATMAGMATLVSDSEYTLKMNGVYQRFGAKSKSDKAAVRAMLVAYFAIHGTSPDTKWASYGELMSASGKEVPPFDVVEIIGSANLKKFMGRLGQSAIVLYKGSPAFRQKMRERVVRAGLDEDDGYLAIDYVGKDGKLDPASMQRRSVAKRTLVSARNADRDISDSRVRGDQAATLAPSFAAAHTGGAVDPFH